MDEHPKEVGEDIENMEGTRRSTDPGQADDDYNQPSQLTLNPTSKLSKRTTNPFD